MSPLPPAWLLLRGGPGPRSPAPGRRGHPAQVRPHGWGDLALGWRLLSLPSIPLTGQFSCVFYRTFQSRKCDRAADRCPYLVFVHEAPLGASSAECPAQLEDIPPQGLPPLATSSNCAPVGLS